MLIIAGFLLELSGCGYKADPYYEEKVPSDENVKFVIQKKEFNNENNESCSQWYAMTSS